LERQACRQRIQHLLITRQIRIDLNQRNPLIRSRTLSSLPQGQRLNAAITHTVLALTDVVRARIMVVLSAG